MSSINTTPLTVSIRTPAGYEYLIETGPEMKKAAYRWTYVLQNRNRWRNDEAYQKKLADKCYAELQEFGLSETQLQELALQPLVEVSIPYVQEDYGWEARTLPWEFLIAEGTRRVGRRNDIAVIRHLNRKSSVRKIRETPKHLAFVTGSVGPIGQYFDFSREQNLVCRGVYPDALTLDAAHGFQNIRNPDLQSLADSLEKSTAEIVHVSGVDTHQAESMFAIRSRQDSIDGMVLQEKEGRQQVPYVVSSQELAKAICAGKPAFVFFNLHNSAARTAALCVAEGAGASVGFQDHVDNQLAETFIGNFYDSLRGGYQQATENEEDGQTQWNVHLAFLAAYELLRNSEPTLRGSGVVLWSAESLWDLTDLGRSLLDQASQIAASISVENEKQVSLETITGAGSGLPQFNIEVKPKKRLNFSLLHNRQAMFEDFLIRKPRGQMKSVRVEVELHIGTERPRFSRVLDLKQEVTSLKDEIFVPLTWMKTELFWESVLISAHVEVTWQDTTLYSCSHAMTMDPADDWVDTDENRQSLPSFVYPRDPAVSEIIQSAQEILFGISDDYSAGFDGYQSIDHTQEDPYAGVDRQVQAIWTSLVRHFKLGYINPPPTFTEYSQRIRTPEEVVRGGRGTCIDLTLLLASCLEYIEIYPVIFLLEGHAFPGYWRSDTDHRDFTVPTDFVVEQQFVTTWQTAPWLIGQGSYEEVLQQIHDGNIVPLESVWLTQNAGFWQAVEQGWENMRIADEFHSLIDVRSARHNDVTPLPIRSLRG